ncbi:UDP-N-acetylmuramoyl-tripeptide--D-alanyl-D-alanine ligase, partial [Patescibacteria group bacterium]|nr:UDP-N-acetylmuramoyl-tripeptide--D-alanyl-D-alanine ligase [Patescibacteria group bacterium]
MAFQLIIFVLWLPQAIDQILSWTYWLQVKEYRFDRFWVFLKSRSGTRNLGIFGILGKLGLMFLSFYFDSIWVFVLLALFVLDCRVIGKIWERSLRKPVFTQRAKRMSGTTVFLVLLAFLFLGTTMQSILLGEVLFLVGPFLGIVWTIPMVNKTKKREIAKAKKRLEKIKPKVIGITGSYGKGTTKDFLAHLLSQKFSVEKSIGSQNTDFGIARKAQKIKKDTEFFIVEMGAYKRGEINKLCEIVNPEVGIITGIEEQHLALFGSLENIRKTKFELVENLPKDGVVFFNLNNAHCRQLAEKAKKLSTNLKVMGFYFQDMGSSKVVGAEMVSKLISINTRGVVFEIKERENKQIISAPLCGTHFVENLTGAILVARYFEVSWKQIEKGCKTIKAPERTMQVYKLGKAVVIDDTFNNTPKGFEAALSYLSLYKKQKKVVITSGIIELGNELVKVHKKLGKIMSDFVDKIILTNTDSVDAVETGLKDNRH